MRKPLIGLLYGHSVTRVVIYVAVVRAFAMLLLRRRAPSWPAEE